jgi:hypothetical protein
LEKNFPLLQRKMVKNNAVKFFLKHFSKSWTRQVLQNKDRLGTYGHINNLRLKQIKGLKTKEAWLHSVNIPVSNLVEQFKERGGDGKSQKRMKSWTKTFCQRQSVSCSLGWPVKYRKTLLSN